MVAFVISNRKNQNFNKREFKGSGRLDINVNPVAKNFELVF